MSIKRSFISRPTILTLAVASTFSSQIAWAAEDSVELDVVKVTANTITPETNSVTAEQIEKFQANDLADLFRHSPEVAVGGGVPVAQKLYIRGIEDKLLNVSIDGATQAGNLYHHNGRISIEPELLKRAEVQAGAGSALNGPGALGGAVRFITKDPTDMLKPGKDFGALLKAGYFSNTDSFKTHTSLFGRVSGSISAMVSYTKADIDDYEDGNGDERLGTGSDQDFMFAKVVGEITDSQTVRLRYEKRRDEGDRAARPQWIVSEGFNDLYQMDLERETITLNYDFNPVDNPWVDSRLTLFNTESELYQNGRFGPYYGCVESKGMDLRNTSVIGMHSVTYGFDYREDKTLAGPETDKRQAEEKGQVKGVYIQDDIQLTEALLLTAGLRYDKYELEDNNGLELNESEVSHNIGLNFKVTETVNVFASYAEAFKGPMAQDSFKLDGWVKDPNLKPEDADNTEAGIAYDNSRLFASAKLYKTNIGDLIADPIGRPNLYENVGDLESKGYVLEAGYRWDQLLASLSFHHNKAEVDNLDANAYDHGGIANSIGNTWTAKLDYQLNPAWSFGWNGYFVERLKNVKTSQGELDKPSYGVHDIYAQWLPMQSQDLRVTLTVSNLFDKNYLDQATNADFSQFAGFENIIGLPEPGRDVRLSVAWQF